MYLTRHGELATGTVIELNPAPLIKFRTADGRVVKYQSHVDDNPPKYFRGDSVPILYDPSDPYTAVIDSFSDLWFGSCLAGGFGVAALAACVFAVYVRIRPGGEGPHRHS